MRNILTLILISSTLTIFGQNSFNYKDDFKTILAKTKDSSDKLFYENLLKRFNLNDSTLTDFEVLALLIGYTDKPDFKPYQDIDTERKIYNINGEGKYNDALDSATVFLEKHPLSVKVIFEKSYSFYKLKQKDSADFYFNKGRKIFEAMNFSGNGMSPETPIFALGPADGQDYIYKFVGSKIGGAKIGTMGDGRDKNGYFLDILEVVPKNGNASYNLYFIIQHATDKMFSADDMKIMEDAIKELDRNDKKK
jgi:hypothetical protein